MIKTTPYLDRIGLGLLLGGLLVDLGLPELGDPRVRVVGIVDYK